MAVVIPKLESFQTPAPASVGRVEASAPDLLGATAPARAGLKELVGSVDQAYKEYRKKEIATKDLKATEIATKYEQKLKADLDKASFFKGDPTPVYKKFDEDMVEFENSIYDEVGDDQETRALLREKIIKANGRIADIRNTNQTKQYYGWQKEVADSSVKLRQDNAMKAASYLDINNPATFGGVRSQLDEIEATRLSIAIQNGYDIKQVDEERVDPSTGQKYRFKGWDYSNAPAVEAQIKADIGDAIIPMVKSLNAAGKVAEAKELIRDQQRWLNANDLAKLTAENDEASVKNRALSELAKLGPNPTIEQINAQKGIGEDVKLKMREINHINSLHAEREKNQKRDAIMGQLANEIDEIKASNTPYVSVEDFKNRSKLWQNNKDMLTVSDRKAIEGLINSKQESDPEAFDDVWQAFKNQELANLSTSQILEIRSKLNSKDGAMFTRMLEQAQKPTSDPQRRSILSSTVKRIDDQMEMMNFSDGTPMFKKKRDGKWDAMSADSANRVRTALEDFIRETPNITIQAEKDKMDELMREEAKRLEKQRQENPLRKLKDFFNGLTGSTSVNPFYGGKEEQVVSNMTVPKPSTDTISQTKPKPTEPNKKTLDTQTKSDMNGWSTAQWMKDYASRNNGKLPEGVQGASISPQAVTILKEWKKKRLSGEIK